MNQCRRPIGDQFMFSLSPTRALMSTIAMGAGFQFAWLFIVTANEMLPAEGLPSRLPTSCDEVKMYRPKSQSGHYWLNVTQYGISGKVEHVTVRIYCHAMETCSPTSYVSLVAPPWENYASNKKERVRGSLDDTCTLGVDVYTYREHGNTTFSKIRVKFPMAVVGNDVTFAETSGLKNVSYGTARSCYDWAPPNIPAGELSINIQGTGLAISDNTTWILLGWQSVFGTFDISEARQKVHVLCGGWFGGCKPHPEIRLAVYRNETLEPDSAAWEWIKVDQTLRQVYFKGHVTHLNAVKNKGSLACARQCAKDQTCTSFEYDDTTDQCMTAHCDDVAQLATKKMSTS